MNPIYEKKVKKYTIVCIGIYIQGGPKKSLWCDLEEKCLGNSKICFEGDFISIYSHLLKKLELFKLCRKNVMGL